MKTGIDFIGIAVCWFCLDEQGRILMQKRGKNCRDEQGKWDTGGGAVEFGDDVEGRLEKEIKEELGVQIQKKEFLGFRNVIRTMKGKKYHWLCLDFKIKVDAKKVVNKEPHKFDEIGWFDLKKLPSNLHSQTLKNLDKYKVFLGLPLGKNDKKQKT